ncbi:MAG: oligosaccharide flippase family protein, partial [Spirochaetia bacterium]
MPSRLDVDEGESSRYDQYFQTERVKHVLKDRAIQGGALTSLTRLASYAIQLVGTVVLARLLAPEDFGLVSMVTSLNGILLQLRDIGLSDAVIQAKTVNQRQMSTLFWINAVSNSGISLAIVFLAPLIAGFYHEPRLQAITVILSLSFIFYGLSDMHFALLKRSMKFWSISAAQIISGLVSTIAAILLAWQGYGYWALVAKNVVLVLCMVIVGWAVCGWRPGLPSRKSGTKHLILPTACQPALHGSPPSGGYDAEQAEVGTGGVQAVLLKRCGNHRLPWDAHLRILRVHQPGADRSCPGAEMGQNGGAVFSAYDQRRSAHHLLHSGMAACLSGKGGSMVAVGDHCLHRD